MIPTMIDVGLLFACCSALALSPSLALSLTTAAHLFQLRGAIAAHSALHQAPSPSGV